MTTEFKIVEEARKPLAMHPKKFAMWLFIASVAMLFAALTSAYIVRQAEGNWLYFELPAMLYWTTGVILLSSVMLQLGYGYARRGQNENLKLMLGITAGLGLVFLIGQMLAWNDLVTHSVYFVGNPSGSFLYVLTGLHGLHIVSALVYLIIVFIAAYRLKINPQNLAQLEMCVTYWHFLGGLWLYLFVFLILNQ